VEEPFYFILHFASDREGYYTWEDQTLSPYACKGTSGGLALCISACDDNQTSVDTTVS